MSRNIHIFLTSVVLSGICSCILWFSGCAPTHTRKFHHPKQPLPTNYTAEELRYRFEMPPKTEEEFLKKEGDYPPSLLWIHTYNAYCCYEYGRLVWWHPSSQRWLDLPPGPGELPNPQPQP